jgi:signal transduction histidine kinase
MKIKAKEISSTNVTFIMKKIIDIRFLTTCAILSIFILDLLVPPGTAMAILYVVPLTISYKLNKKLIIMFTIIMSFLAVIDTAITYHSGMHFSVFIDRILSIFAIWVSSFVILRYKIVREKKEEQKEKYIKSIEDILFKISHEIRRPVCNIQGITNALDYKNLSKDDLAKTSHYLKDSVAEIDTFTKTLTEFLNKIHKESMVEEI